MRLGSTDWGDSGCCREKASSRCVRLAARSAPFCAEFEEAIGIAVLLRELPLRKFDAADDDGEHIVEIVRQAARELADGFHLLRLSELLGEFHAALPFGRQGDVRFAKVIAGLADLAHLPSQATDRRRADRERGQHRRQRAEPQYLALGPGGVEPRVHALLLYRRHLLRLASDPVHERLAGVGIHQGQRFVLLAGVEKVDRPAKFRQLRIRKSFQLRGVARVDPIGAVEVRKRAEIGVDASQGLVVGIEVGLVGGKKISALAGLGVHKARGDVG